MKVPLGWSQVRLRGSFDVARSYFLLGVEHILSGWDHLAFVLCLCLLARGWRLVKLVTGFTLGHSVSLALAAFDAVRLPSPPTEACIALSIAFVAREALLPRALRRHGPGMVFAFGLLHGLGFAGALPGGRHRTGRAAARLVDVQSRRGSRAVTVRSRHAHRHRRGKPRRTYGRDPDRVCHELGHCRGVLDHATDSAATMRVTYHGRFGLDSGIKPRSGRGDRRRLLERNREGMIMEHSHHRLGGTP